MDQLLSASVKSQLVADAPVGALCSGGIDSSIILAIAAARTIITCAIFHANVTGPLSEFKAAERLAKHLRLDIKSVEARHGDLIDGFRNHAHYGQPFYPCPHSVPFLMVSHLIHEHKVKAVLSGEGADECFFGYQPLRPAWRCSRATRSRAPFSQIPVWVSSCEKFELSRAGLRAWRRREYRDPALVLAMHNRCEVFEEALAARQRLASLSDEALSQRHHRHRFAAL